MGRLGRADGKPGYHSPNIGGSVSSKLTITEANGTPMPTVTRSSISHRKLSSSTVLPSRLGSFTSGAWRAPALK
jgi:hypothetical protein